MSSTIQLEGGDRHRKLNLPKKDPLAYACLDGRFRACHDTHFGASPSYGASQLRPLPDHPLIFGKFDKRPPMLPNGSVCKLRPLPHG